MATQKSIIQLTGNLGNLNFYRRKGKYLVRSRPQKGSYSESALEHRRKLNAEFGSAAGSVKLLKSAFPELFAQFTDYRAHCRLQKLLLEILKSDPVNPVGERTVVDGDWNIFRTFHLDPKFPIYKCCRLFLEVGEQDGKMKVKCMPFSPVRDLITPPNATHFRLNFTFAFVDFQKAQVHHVNIPQPLRAIDSETQGMSFEFKLPDSFVGELFMGVSMQSFVLVNGAAMAYQDRRFKGAYLERIMALEDLSVV